MVAAFKPEDEANITHKFDEIMGEKKEEAKKFVLSLMENIPAYPFSAGTDLYTIDAFIAEQHDRVMTKDNYRLHKDLFWAYTQEAEKLMIIFLNLQQWIFLKNGSRYYSSLFTKCSLPV